MFSNWIHELGLFIFAVIAHWQSYVTGGIVMAIVATYENRRDKKVSKPSMAFIFIAFALYAFFAAWQDEHRNSTAVITEKAAIAGLLNTCVQDARVEEAYKKGLQNLNDSQRQTIDRQQIGNDAQQRDVSSCVVSLGKLNPKVRERIVVVVIRIGITDRKGTFVTKSSLFKTYQDILLVTTNENEPRFNGNLRCAQPFTVTGIPLLPASSQSVMSTHAVPNQISDREFEVSASDSGTQWSPENPAYMTTSSDVENIGPCTFTPRG